MEVKEIGNFTKGVEIIDQIYVSPILNYFKNKTLGPGIDLRDYIKCHR